MQAPAASSSGMSTPREVVRAAPTGRWRPVAALLLLAPFVAELLLGDFALPMAGMIVVMLPMYGGGALLIREVAVRRGLGLIGILLLGLAYGLVEEGLVTQSLFDPSYADADLLSQAPLHFLGMGAAWTVLVLSLHAFWSIATPIAVVTSAARPQLRSPWLGRVGLAVTGVGLVGGCVLMGAFSRTSSAYRDSVAQVAVTVVAAAIVTAIALLRRAPLPRAGSVPPPWALGVVTAVLGSAVVLWAPRLDGWWSVLVVVAAVAAFLLPAATCERRQGLGRAHVLAAAAGAMAAYAAHAFANPALVGDASPGLDRIGDIVYALVAGAIVVLAWALARRWPATSWRPERGLV